MSKAPDLATSAFWADTIASELIETWGAERYHIESGITPSGTIHIGNFREVITHDLIRRALEDRGHSVTFYYIWDDFDRFRKVPKNMPQPEMLAEHLDKPVCDVPDPFGKDESYARMNEARFEAELELVGVPVTYVYQAEEYRRGEYVERIREALRATDTIKGIIDEYRKEPLREDWLPAQVYSRWNGSDRTEVIDYDGAYGLTYRCTDTGNEETIDFRTDHRVKLRWRVDWPMRWAHKDIHFEAAGKDHHSAGSSYDTGKRIVRDVWHREPPSSIVYNFVTPKGMGGKISSSAGNAITISDVLEVYTPELVRFLFAGSRPNAEFSIPFDDNVLKVYEDFDSLERAYYSFTGAESKDQVQTARIYEMSVLDRTSISDEQPLQPSFRQLVMLSQAYESDEHVLAHFEVRNAADRERILSRMRCARNWAKTYAVPAWRFTRNTTVPDDFSCSDAERAVFRTILERLEAGDDAESLGSAMSAAMHEHGVKPKDFFKKAYSLLVNNTSGPRLAPYLIAEKERAVPLLRML
jgi:lysyl-tRNA synthetase, class I